MVVAEGPKYLMFNAFGEGYFCYEVYIDFIAFSFYVKQIWKKCYKNFLDMLF